MQLTREKVHYYMQTILPAPVMPDGRKPFINFLGLTVFVNIPGLNHQQKKEPPS